MCNPPAKIPGHLHGELHHANSGFLHGTGVAAAREDEQRRAALDRRHLHGLQAIASGS
jgi:hypothetical protein